LKWQDIDWQLGTVSVVRTLKKVKGSWRFANNKRDRSRRVIKLQEWVLENLTSLHARRARSICDIPETADLVCTTPAGHPIHADKLAQRFKAILPPARIVMDLSMGMRNDVTCGAWDSKKESATKPA
jgi:integrase